MATAPAVDEQELQRIARDANTLLPSDAASAHALLGRVATLRWDLDEAKRRYSLAIPLGDPAPVLCDYADSLTFLGQIDDAFDAAQAAFERVPDDLTVLRRLIVAALSAGRFGHALTLRETWEKLSPADDMPHREILEQLAEAAASGQFTENGVRSFLRCAATVRRDHRMRLASISIEPFVTEPDTFSAVLRVFGSTDEVFCLISELADIWANSSALVDDPGLRFVPMLLCH